MKFISASPRSGYATHLIRGGIMLRWMVPAALMLMASAAHAEEHCALYRLASLELQRQGDGRLTIPVTIAGTQQSMVVDIANQFPMLHSSFAEAEKLKSGRVESNMRYHVFNLAYIVPDLVIGMAHISNAEFIPDHAPPKPGDTSVGVLGLDILSHFDVELDLKHSRLNLFSKDHCENIGAYWTKSNYAALSLTYDEVGHPYTDMVLDEKTVRVSFGLIPGHAHMSLKTAGRLFGIEKNTYRLSKIENTPTNEAISYRYPFKSLSAGEITITNPAINIHTDWVDCRAVACSGISDVTLTQDVLSQLRLYFSFDEDLVYVTSADAH